jgi:hypothetical protein
MGESESIWRNQFYTSWSWERTGLEHPALRTTKREKHQKYGATQQNESMHMAAVQSIFQGGGVSLRGGGGGGAPDYELMFN